MDRRTLLATLASGAAMAATPFARAQDYPSQLIKWVVPYPAGGGTDVIARTLAEAMRQALGAREGAFYLLRPDGHVAARWQRLPGGALAEALHRAAAAFKEVAA